MLSSEEIKYAIKIIINIAFNSTNYYHIQDNAIKIENKIIEFSLMDKIEFNNLIKGNLDMKKIKNFNGKRLIPIYNECDNFFENKKDKIIINADIITLPFLLLSRKEELIINSFDEYKRFKYEDSLCKKYNIIDIPIVDEYAFLLKNELCELMNINTNVSSQFNIYLTHDVDNLFRYGNFRNNFKTIIGGDLIRRHSFSVFKKSLIELKKYRKNKLNDPRINAVFNLINDSVSVNLKSHFFFLAYDLSDTDFRYDINNYRVSKIIEQIKDKKMFFGLHTGQNASNDINSFNKQIEKLSKYGKIKENRNHFLMYNCLNTPLILEKNNIEYDYSLGYPYKSGFKCGTCHEYHLFDLKNNKELNVIERPLIVMDGSIRDEEGLTMGEGLKRIKYLYDICKEVLGNFIILWHPDSTIREWEGWYNNVYKKFLEEME